MDDVARRAKDLVVTWLRDVWGRQPPRDCYTDLEARIATALRELEAERDEIRDNWERSPEAQIGCVMQERDALATRLARVEGALRPFTSGGNWGKWKAWLVEGARHLGKVSEGLDAAQAITRWQCQVDEAVAVLTPDTMTEGTHE